MSSEGSVTHWIELLRAGEASAAQKIWARYCTRLIALAREKLRGAPCRAADEEDVALSVFDSFCRGVARGAFPHLEGRNNLWQLLVVLTARKAIKQTQHDRAEKRQPRDRKVVGEADLSPNGSAEGNALDDLVGREPTPEFAAQVAEEYRFLLERLNDEELRSIARWKMEGYSNREIADKLNCVERTVERKLRVIRGLWEGLA